MNFKHYFKIFFVEGMGLLISFLVVNYVFMKSIPLVRPDFIAGIKDSPTAIANSVKDIPAVISGISVSFSKITQGLNKGNSNSGGDGGVQSGEEARILDPWVFTPAPGYENPGGPNGNNQPTAVPSVGVTQPVQPTQNPLGTVFPTSATQPTAQPTQPPLPTQPPRPTSIPAPTYPTIPPSQSENQLEQQVLTLINQERAKAGVNQVTSNEYLRQAARRHSKDQSTNGCNGHVDKDGSTPEKRTRESGYRGNFRGEIMGCGHLSAESVVTSQRGWLFSPRHKAIMLDSSAREIGVGWVGNVQTAVFGY